LSEAGDRQVLAVVQHQQQLALTQGASQLVERRAPAVERQTKRGAYCGSQCVGLERGIGARRNAGERRPPGAIGERSAQRPRRRERETSFAGTAHAYDRDEPGVSIAQQHIDPR
jgi:hypothetical protein